MSTWDSRDKSGHSKNFPAGRAGHGFPLKGNPSVPASRPDRLRDLSRRIGRLSPDWRNPERFFEERGEIERDLRTMAREVERDG
jgi:hypothetical protein